MFVPLNPGTALGFHTALTGRESFARMFSQGFTLHPTDEDQSVGTTSWAIFDSSLPGETALEYLAIFPLRITEPSPPCSSIAAPVL